MLSDDVDHRRPRFAGVVKIGQRVAEAGAEMQERGGGAAKHARVSVGRAGAHAFKEAEHAAHAFDAVERRDELHFGRAGVHEAGVDSRLEQGSEEAFGAEHACSILPKGSSGVHRRCPGAGRSAGAAR